MGKHQWRIGAAFGLLTLDFLTGGLPARSAGTSGKVVTIDVADADFGTVVAMLQRQANVDVTIRQGDQPFKHVSVHLVDKPLEYALRKIAFSAHASVSRDTDGGYVFEPESSTASSSEMLPAQTRTASLTTDADNSASTVDENAPRHFPPGSLHWQAIVLQHAVPSELLRLMHWDKDVVEPEPFRPLSVNSNQPVLSSTQPGVILPSQLPPGYSSMDNNNYGTYGGGNPSVPVGTGNPSQSQANYSAHRSAGAPDQANQFPGGGFGGGFPGGGGGFGGGFPGGGRGGFGGNPFQPNQTGPNGGVGGPGGRGQQAQLPEGVERIYALQSNNSLLVRATPEGFNELRRLVKILDIAPRQVQVKVEFVTASVTDVDNLGVNFDLVPYPGLEFGTTQGNSTLVTGVQPTFLQYATGNIVAQLYQTLTRTRGKVVQAPLITTTNNVQATIQISTQIPFFTSSTVSTGGLNNNTFNNQQANFLQLQTFLTITPRINSDDSVTMNLSPQITDTTGQAAVGGIPPTITQNVTTLRTVRSGDTMVLGGLVRKQETASSQRIPILSDIPILGGLFRTRNKQINDQELLIFVTPTIIGESNDSATANANGGQSVTVTP